MPPCTELQQIMCYKGAGTKMHECLAVNEVVFQNE